jgi:hypothetical protein
LTIAPHFWLSFRFARHPSTWLALNFPSGSGMRSREVV